MIERSFVHRTFQTCSLARTPLYTFQQDPFVCINLASRNETPNLLAAHSTRPRYASRPCILWVLCIFQNCNQNRPLCLKDPCNLLRENLFLIQYKVLKRKIKKITCRKSDERCEQCVFFIVELKLANIFHKWFEIWHYLIEYRKVSYYPLERMSIAIEIIGICWRLCYLKQTNRMYWID